MKVLCQFGTEAAARPSWILKYIPISKFFQICSNQAMKALNGAASKGRAPCVRPRRCCVEGGPTHPIPHLASTAPPPQEPPKRAFVAIRQGAGETNLLMKHPGTNSHPDSSLEVQTRSGFRNSSGVNIKPAVFDLL